MRAFSPNSFESGSNPVKRPVSKTRVGTLVTIAYKVESGHFMSQLIGLNRHKLTSFVVGLVSSNKQCARRIVVWSTLIPDSLLRRLL